MSDVSFQDIKKAYFSKPVQTKTNLCYSQKSINVRPIKMKDKKDFLKLLEKEDDSLLDNFIDDLVEKYVADDDGNPISAATLVDQERHQILMLIRRASTMQDSVTIDHMCPKCKVFNKDIIFPLANVVTNDFKKPDGLEDVIVSKNGDVKFQIGHLTRGEVIEIEKYILEKKIDTKVEKEFIYLASTVKELYLNADDITRKYTPKIAERVEFIENLVFDDFDKIREYFSKCAEFGLSLQFNFKCTECEYKNEKEEAKIVNFFIK